MTREEAIERFNGIINAMSISIAQSKFYPSKAELDELCDMAIEALSAEAVHGKWIPIEETLPTYDGGEKTWLTGMKCSNCGKLFDLRVGYKFCPSCGSRMKGGAE